MNERDLEACCVGLDSSKVSERKKYADNLRDLLSCNDTIELLNRSSESDGWRNWNYVFSSVQRYIKREGEKLCTDEPKSKSSHTTISRIRSSCHNLLLLVVDKSNSAGGKLEVSKFVESILNSLSNSTVKKYFAESYFHILFKYVLLNRKYWGQIDTDLWKKIYHSLKNLITDPIPDIPLQNVISALHLTVKWGCLHSALSVKLRTEFDFIKSICQSLKSLKSKSGQEMGLQLLITFSIQMANDCRFATCKLGEDLILSLSNLYEPRYEKYGSVKSLMFDYFLLQVRLHHPCGSLDENLSYAHDWTSWRSSLKNIYTILRTEMEVFERSANDKWNLWPNFCDLFVDVARQILNTNVHDITQTSNFCLDITQPSISKKPRLDVGISAAIHAIKFTNSKTWLVILEKLLRLYPDVIQPSDFLNLLECVAELQGECKDLLERDQVYNILCTMLQAQDHLPQEFLDMEKINNLWSKIWETSLRSVGLNQNITSTHNLLQVLLYYNGISQQERSSLLQIYTTDTVNVSIDSIKTLYKLCTVTTIPEHLQHCPDTFTRTLLIKWTMGLLNNKLLNSSVFKERVTAELLAGLVLKTWPYKNRATNDKNLHSKREFGYIEEMSKLVCFETDFFLTDTSETVVNSTTNTHLIHQESFNDLKEILIQLNSNLCDTASNLNDLIDMMNGAVLILHLLSDLYTFGVVPDTDLHDFVNIHELMGKICCISPKYLSDKKGTVIVMEQIERLFSLQVCEPVSTSLRNQVPTDLIKMIFNLLDDENNCDEDDNVFFEENDLNDSQNCVLLEKNLKGFDKTKLQAMNVLSKYCCVPNSERFTETQEYALETLSDPNFNPVNLVEAQTTLCIIRALNSCKIGSLNTNCLNFILQSVSNLLQYWHQDYEASVLLIEVLKDTLQHVIHSTESFLRRAAVMLLDEFFKKRDCYGPSLTVTVIECFGIILNMNLFDELSKDILEKMFEYLKSNHLEVRLSAVRVLASIFVTETSSSSLHTDREKKLFKEIYTRIMRVTSENEEILDMSEENLDLKNNITVCTLHTYVSVIMKSPTWGKKSLFTLIKYISKKHLKKEFAWKVLQPIARNLKIPRCQDYLNMNISYIIMQWSRENRDFNEFPFHLFECDTSLKFFTRNVNVLVPVLLQSNDTEVLRHICHEMEKSLDEIIQDSFPVIMAQFLPPYILASKSREYFISNDDVIMSKRLFTQLEELYSSSKVKNYIYEMSDDILIQLLRRFHDIDHFEEQFGFKANLSEPDPPVWNYKVLLFTIKNIENLLQDENPDSFVVFYGNYFPKRLEHILSELTVSLYKSLIPEEKLRALHRYSVITDFISNEITNINNQMTVFLMRSIIYTFMNIIKINQCTDMSLCVATCRYFKKFCVKCLPAQAVTFEKYLRIITCTLVPIAKLNTDLSNECLNLLKFLIVENVRDLFSTIGKLDPFPSDPKFEEIAAVYEKIKYGNEKFSLKQEIEHFLNAGQSVDVTDRTEGLQHLRKELGSRKLELSELYQQLNEIREFSEDRRSSILHQLICMLVKLTASSNCKVSLEAAKCLGELGPGDLTTLCLMAEQPLPDEEFSPLELVTAHILTLLIQYLVSDDINVTISASRALYNVASTKEAKVVIDKMCDMDFGYGPIQKAYLVPFWSQQETKSSDVSIDEKFFVELISNINLWCPSLACSHEEWITLLVCKLLKVFPNSSCYLEELIPVCHAKVEFSEKVLPLLIYLILNKNNTILSNVIKQQFKAFFANHWKNTMARKSVSETDIPIYLNKKSIKCLLNVIHFLRLQSGSEINSLELNYLQVAKAAQFCSAHFTSILYAELWCYNQLERYEYSAQSGITVFDHLRENESQETACFVEDILREGYKKVGDRDAMYGCGTSYLTKTSSRVEYYKDIGKWDKVTLHYDMQLQHNPSADVSALVHSLKQSSLHYLASHVELSDTQYECAWRLSQWDLFDNSSKAAASSFDKHHYFSMKFLHEGDFPSLYESLTNARKATISTLAHASLESSKNLYPALTQLSMIQEIENVCNAQQNMSLADVLEQWRDKPSLIKNDFEFLEPLKAQRITILNDLLRRNVGDNNTGDLIKPLLAESHLKLAAEARSQGFLHVAQRSLVSLSFLENLPVQTHSQILLEQAQLSWLDDKISSRYMLRRFLDINNETNSLYPQALKLYGTWLAETRSENASVIIEKYFERSLNILNSYSDTTENIANMCEVLDCLARFADTQYQQVINYMNSTVFKSKRETIEKLRNMAQRFSRTSTIQDERRAILLYEKQCKIDIKEIENIQNECNTYLLLAVKQYIKILSQSDKYNLKIFRILSLCVDNKNNSELLSTLKTSLFNIATYKYIPLIPQLVPHLSNNADDVFESLVTKIILNCAVDHPHHTLPALLALADSYKDRTFDADSKGEKSEARVQVAKELVQQLSKNKKVSPIIKNMQKLSSALISLAYLETGKYAEKKKAITIPRGEEIRMIKNFDNILLPTITLPIRKDCDYSNIVGVREYEHFYNLVGGVNAPKRIVCIGTDGVRRTQLVKGKDDLRQDAVMQQVFRILNTLLANNQQTNKLRIRTYKVVPLSQRSGVIEWCENTEPIGVYLCEAHQRYHPNDLAPQECRNQIRKVASEEPKTKLRVFKSICEKFRPVFHMFFIASFPQPTIWFERRRAYMHSVATSSMVGYILGLGDRHVTNILIDKNNAEVIHIDFGIAFEQGRTLPTPETVPFRLTRDIEAGMGVCGIEGVFRRSCEKTMHLLRQNAETIISILEVLLYDPLYAWTITPAEAYSRQRDEEQDSLSFSDDKDDTRVNVTAERVLSRLRQKLQGTEEGGVYSVEGQVELLLQQARDIENLSRLYNGWQAFL